MPVTAPAKFEVNGCKRRWADACNHLITYVRYDDWPRRPAAAGPAKGTLNYGQALAHHELTAKYGIKWSQLDVKGYGAYVFKVSCLGSGCLVPGGVA